MKKLFFVVIVLSSFQSLAETPPLPMTPSEKMVVFLSNHEIYPVRKHQIQEATIKCKIPKRTNEPLCTLFAGPSGYELNSNNDVILGQDAVELSKLLLDFNVKPTGKKSIQYAQIICKTTKQNPEGPSSCEQAPHYFTPTN